MEFYNPWATPFGISQEQIEQWKSQVPASRSLISWCLENGHLDADRYLAWALEYYQLPQAQNKFLENPPSPELTKKYKNETWPEHLVLLGEQEGTLFVGCLEPVPAASIQSPVQWLILPFSFYRPQSRGSSNSPTMAPPVATRPNPPPPMEPPALDFGSLMEPDSKVSKKVTPAAPQPPAAVAPVAAPVSGPPPTLAPPPSLGELSFGEIEPTGKFSLPKEEPKLSTKPIHVEIPTQAPQFPIPADEGPVPPSKPITEKTIPGLKIAPVPRVNQATPSLPTAAAPSVTPPPLAMPVASPSVPAQAPVAQASVAQAPTPAPAAAVPRPVVRAPGTPPPMPTAKVTTPTPPPVATSTPPRPPGPPSAPIPRAAGAATPRPIVATTPVADRPEAAAPIPTPAPAVPKPVGPPTPLSRKVASTDQSVPPPPPAARMAPTNTPQKLKPLTENTTSVVTSVTITKSAPKPHPALTDDPEKAAQITINPSSQIMDRKNVQGLSFVPYYALSQLREYFDKTLVLLYIGENLQPWKWDERWNNPNGNAEPIPLENASIFKIVHDTRLPYHGYIVNNPVNDQFFKVWNSGQTPDHITICPIRIGNVLAGMILGITTKLKSTRVRLDQIEAIAETTAELLVENRDRKAA